MCVAVRTGYGAAQVPYGTPLTILVAMVFGLGSGHCWNLTTDLLSNPAGRYLEFKEMPLSTFARWPAK